MLLVGRCDVRSFGFTQHTEDEAFHVDVLANQALQFGDREPEHFNFASQTLLVLRTPPMQAARATLNPPSGPWARRRPNSITSAPRARMAAFFSTLLPCGTKIVTVRSWRRPAKARLWPWLPRVALTTPSGSAPPRSRRPRRRPSSASRNWKFGGRAPRAAAKARSRPCRRLALRPSGRRA